MGESVVLDRTLIYFCLLLMFTSHSNVYEKPKQEFQESFEDQKRKKKKRIWQGKVPEGQRMSPSSWEDDDIFNLEKKVKM